MAFAELEELSVLVGYTVEVARANLVLEIASAAVVDAADVPIEQVVNDELVLPGSGSSLLLLPAWPVTAVGSVTADGVTLTADSYSWTRAGELRRPAGWSRDTEYLVTYTHGYQPEEIPTAVKSVTLQVAARIVANPQAMSQLSTDGMAGRFAANALTDDECDLVARAIR